MPRLPTIRVMGSHAISTSWPGSRFTWDGSGMIVVIESCSLYLDALRCRAFGAMDTAAGRARAGETRTYQVRVAPVSSFVPGWRHFGSLSTVRTGDVAQAADHRSVQARRGGRDLAAGRLVHERHELVREAGHRAADADAADVRAAADAVDPSAFGHVALHDRAPTAKFHNAFRRSVLGREIALLVVAGPVTALVHRSAPNSHLGRSASSSGIIGACSVAM